MKPPAHRLDPTALLATPLHWEIDPTHQGWLEATTAEGAYYLRINPNFPSVPLYSLLVSADETVDFDDLPATWTRTDNLTWPSTAIPLDIDDDWA